MHLIHIRMLCVYIFAQCDGSFPNNPSTEFNLTTVDGWLKDWQPSRWIKRETVRVCQGHALLPQSPVIVPDHLKKSIGSCTAFVNSCSSGAAVPWASQNCRVNTCWVRSLAAGLDLQNEQNRAPVLAQPSQSMRLTTLSSLKVDADFPSYNGNSYFPSSSFFMGDSGGGLKMMLGIHC